MIRGLVRKIIPLSADIFFRSYGRKEKLAFKGLTNNATSWLWGCLLDGVYEVQNRNPGTLAQQKEDIQTQVDSYCCQIGSSVQARKLVWAVRFLNTAYYITYWQGQTATLMSIKHGEYLVGHQMVDYFCQLQDCQVYTPYAAAPTPLPAGILAG